MIGKMHGLGSVDEMNKTSNGIEMDSTRMDGGRIMCGRRRAQWIRFSWRCNREVQ